jgi:acyl-CoA synthetase (NDP forming)
VVSQSGSAIVALIRSQRGLAFSHLISSGNEAVVTAADYLRYLVAQPSTKVLAAFLEGVKDPARFVAAAAAARRANKRLAVLRAGRSAAGRAANLAHTGSLAGSNEVHDALFRQDARPRPA